MSQPDLTNRLNQAIQLLNAGQRAEARTMLLELSRQYPDLEVVWMWLSVASEDTNERISHLRRVLAINPRSEKARIALTRLTGSTESIPVEGQTAPSGVPRPMQGIELILVLVLVGALVTLAVVIFAVVLGPRLGPTPTPTATGTATATRTATMTAPPPTPLPTITPGGPTLTPVNPLPPTWTPRPSSTARPSNTPPPTLTPLPSITPRPSRTPTQTPSPTLTETPSATPS